MLEALLPDRLGTPFRWLVGSSWLTNLGDGIAVAAGPLLVAGLTRNPVLIALAAGLQWLPRLLLGLLAGVLADRLDRRRVLLISGGLRIGVLAGLIGCLAAGRLSVPIVLITVALLGTVDTVAETTNRTLLPMLVAPDDLGPGNARMQAGFLVGNQLIGPPIGAALFAAGMAWPFLAQAVLIGSGLIMISRLVLPVLDPASSTDSGSRADRRISTDIVDGARWLWSHPPVRTLTLMILSFNVAYGATTSVLVLYAGDRLGLGEIGFGLISTAIAVGGLIAMSRYDWFERTFDAAVIMKAGLAVETLTHLALALTTSTWVAMAVFGVFGGQAFVWGTTAMSVRQRSVPLEIQGRVGGFYLMGLTGGLVLGSALGGLLARVWGVTAPFWFAFVASALMLAGLWRQLDHIADTA